MGYEPQKSNKLYQSLEKREKCTGEILKNPVEKIPQNCRFLSLVVVENILL